MSDDKLSSFEHPLGRRRKTVTTSNSTPTVEDEPQPRPNDGRKSISWGDVQVRTPKRVGNNQENVQWRDHRRHLGSFEDERALKALSGQPRTKIQVLKQMRKMRRAALRDSPSARKILSDPRGHWILIVVLLLLTLLGIHFCCDTWIEALILLTFVTVVTIATATFK
jgi:hypothetical protein